MNCRMAIDAIEMSFGRTLRRKQGLPAEIYCALFFLVRSICTHPEMATKITKGAHAQAEL